MAFTESSFNFDVNHPDSETEGIGGIKNKFYGISNPNSLIAIEQAWLACMKLHNNDFHKALKHYKGSVKNLKSYYMTLRLYNRIKDIKWVLNLEVKY